MKEMLTGFISGIISGTGMGGGTILILFLSMFLGMNQKEAQAVNLFFFIPTSMAAIVINIHQKKICFKTAKIVMVAGIIGSGLGAFFAQTIKVELLKKCFGIFLIGIAIHEIYLIYQSIKNKNKTILNTKEER